VKPGPQTINAAGQITDPNVRGFIATEILPLVSVFRKMLSTLRADSMHEILEARLRPQRVKCGLSCNLGYMKLPLRITLFKSLHGLLLVS